MNKYSEWILDYLEHDYMGSIFTCFCLRFNLNDNWWYSQPLGTMGDRYMLFYLLAIVDQETADAIIFY